MKKFYFILTFLVLTHFAFSETWYSLISGNWEDPTIWTLDPSGTSPDPIGGGNPAATDSIFILSGKTVTINANNTTANQVTITGRLDIQSYTGTSFAELYGTGILLLSADNFPVGDATHFVTEGMGEGTVRFYGNSFSAATSLEVFNLEIEMNDASQIVTILDDYVINGDLSVNTGTLQVNDNSATTNLNITVNGDVTVGTDGIIKTGSANARHQLNLYGDLTINGEAEFTNRSSAGYSSEATDGIVDVNFLHDSQNQNIECNGPSTFYRIEIDKGTDDTYELSIEASDASNFHLYGYAGQGHGSTAQLADNANALGLIRGTVRLKVNIDNILLNNTGNYNISEAAHLWIDGGSALKEDGTAIVPYGKITVSDGNLTADVGSGITLRENGAIKVEGGTVDAIQIRTSVYGAAHVGSYVQTGGYVTLTGNGAATDYYVFNLTFTGNAFQMSGGTLHIEQAYGRGGIFIACDPGNVNVTGGTVIMEIDDGNDFEITSTAEFYNVILRNSNGSGSHTLVAGTDVGNTNEDLDAQPLVALNDLTIEDDATLVTNDNDVKVGDDFDLKDGGAYNAGDNTTWFTGSGTSVIYVRNTANAGELQFNNMTIAKNQRYNTSLFYQVQVNGGSRAVGNHPLEILGDIYIQRGEFNVEEYEVDLKGNIEIVDGQILADDPIPGKIVLNSTSGQQSIKGSYTTEQEFGAFELDNSDGAILLSNINVTDFELTQGIMDLDTYNLYVSGDISTTGTYSSTLMYKTAGNSGDGGLTLNIDLSSGAANTAYIFPFGTGTNYTPATVIQASTVADAGEMTIKPVNSYHPATSDPSKTIPYYWAVDTTGFSSIIYTDLKYTFTYPGAFPSSVNKGSNLWDGDYDWYTHNSVVNGSDIEFPYAAYLTEDFTLGNNSVFIKPQVFYTRDDAEQADWTDGDTWTERDDLIDANGDGDINEEDWHDSRQPAAGDYPQAGDIAIIGWVPWDDPNTARRGQPHSARWNSGDLECAEIMFTQMLDASGNPTERVYRNNFQFRPTFTINSTGTMTVAKISGEGTIRVRDGSNIDPDFSSVDISNFATQDSSYFLYEAFSDKTYSNSPEIFPNLFISNDGWGANDRDITIDKSITVFGNFEVRGNANYVLPTGADGDLVIYGDLIVDQDPVGTGGAEFAFGNTGTARSVYVYGDLLVNGEDCKVWVRSPENSDIVDHTFSIEGNITQSTTGTNDIIRFWTADDEDRVTLYLLGDESTEYTRTSGDVTELYRVVMNKNAAGLVTFDFENELTLNGPTDTEDKALELISGRLGLHDSNIDITLTSGGGDFEIPSGSELWIGSSSTIRATGSNTGIRLDGKLTIGFGCNALINDGTNNYIEYTASGNAEININSGSAMLLVGSQIRRSTDSNEGILKFSLTNNTSTVIIGTDAGNIPENNRGVFEVLNAGSELELTDNATIILANAQNNPQVASLYLDPGTCTLGAGSVFQIGSSDTDAGQEFGVYSSVPLKNVTIDNTNTNDPIVTMWTVPLTIEENLTIGADTEFDANGLDVFIEGDFTNNGEYTANGNTIYFNGSANQDISGETTFYNFISNNSNTLYLNSNIDIDNVMTVNSGTLSDQGNEVEVQGFVYFYGTHDWGDSGEGIIFNGASQQKLETTGTLGKITINNINGVYVPTESTPISVDDEVQLLQGVFDVGKNLLVMNSNAVFTGNTFSETNMVQTNISFTDNGIKKIFNGSETSFVMPIGSVGKYTPLTLNSLSVNANGAIRVKAADEMQHTIVDDSDECDEFDDTQNVLQYYWRLKAYDITSFTSDLVFEFYDTDVSVNNTDGYDETDYIAARLLAGSNTWNKFDAANFDESSNQILFSLTGVDNDGISGDYTAGIEQGATCNGAIPNIIPEYISDDNNDWNLSGTWLTVPDGDPGPAGGPIGAIVEIVHEVTIPTNYYINYKTEITGPNGILKVNETFGHRLGYLSGNGTLYLERGDMPAVEIDEFVEAGAGTFEFGGSNSYDILSEVPIVNNVTLSGTGERRFPNIDLVLNGDLLINGDDNTLDAINEFDRDWTIKGDITINSGTFDAGNSSSKITLDGTSVQTISGTNDFTGTNAFQNLEIDKSAETNITTSVGINEILYLTDGIVNTSASSPLIIYESAGINNPEAFNNSTHIDGPLQKEISSGSFIYPVGNDGRYGQVELDISASTGDNIWEVQYYNDNPDPTYPTSPTATYLEPDITFVSDNEYWRVEAPNTGSPEAIISLQWDNESKVLDDDPDLVILRWNSSTSLWEKQTTTINASDKTLSCTIDDFDGAIGYEQIFTIASTAPITTYTWEGDVDEEWENGANWQGNPAIPPTITNDVVIPDVATQPSIAGNALCKSIELEEDADLTINTGASLTVDEDITINTNSNITIKDNSSNNNGQLYAGGDFISNGGEAVFERYLGLRAHHYISSPVDESNYTLNVPKTAKVKLYWDESDGAWKQITSNLTSIGMGYDYYYESNVTAKFSGNSFNLNNTYSVPVTRGVGEGYNLIGNPYPFSIYAESLLNANTQVLGGANSITGNIAIWDEGSDLTTYNESFYIIVNAAGSVSGKYKTFNGYIAATQAFFVTAAPSTTGTFEVNKTMAEPNHQAVFFKSGNKPAQVQKVKLFVDNGVKLYSEVLFAFKDGATFEEDIAFDAGNIESGKLSLYSFIDENTYAIQTQPLLLDNDNRVIELGVNVKKAGTVEFNIKDIINIDADTKIFIEDMIKDTIVELGNEMGYFVELTKKRYDKRFRLIFSKQPAQSITNTLKSKFIDNSTTQIVASNIKQSGSNNKSTELTNSIHLENKNEPELNIYSYKKTVYIKSSDISVNRNSKVYVYNLMGELILAKQIHSTLSSYQIPNNTGIYIVHVFNENMNKQQKVFIE